NVNVGLTNVFLGMLGRELGPLEHAVLILDGASWHKSKRLAVPDDVTILLLPPYAPELNPIERLWAYLHGRYLSDRAYSGCRHLLEAGTEVWNTPDAETIRSVCRCPYLEREIQA